MKGSKNALAEVITNARSKKGISMRELARLSGMDHAEISRIEKGTRLKPNILFLRRLAENLDLSLVDLLKTAGYSEIDISWGSGREDNKSIVDLKKELEDIQVLNNNLESSVSVYKNETRKIKSDIEHLMKKIEIEKDKIYSEVILEELSKIDKKIESILEEN
jgi:transcriptional regulator with XRE-family HTH domain